MFKKVVLFSSSENLVLICQKCFPSFVIAHIVDCFTELLKTIATVRPDCIFIDVRYASLTKSYIDSCLYGFSSIPLFYITESEKGIAGSAFSLHHNFFFLPQDKDQLIKIFSNNCFDEANDIVMTKDLEKLAGNSQSVKTIRKKIALAASKNIPVLILGESGTGKTLAAELIHRMSVRSKKIFYSVNVASVPSGLIESELFGTVRGAFTNSDDRKGYFLSANEGTLFLDEIGELDYSIQPKLLHVIENGKFRRIGSDKETYSDARFIFATNADLKAKVKLKQFREDLYYRINKFTIRIPPLRERIEDIPQICDNYLKSYGKVLSSSAEKLLETNSWPGNIRQLQNCLARASLISDSKIIRPEAISFD